MRVVLLGSLVGCGSVSVQTPPGHVGLCVDGPGVAMSEARSRWTFSGPVTSLDPVDDPAVSGCRLVSDGARWAQVTDEIGDVWTVGWAATEGAAVEGGEEPDQTPLLDLAVGDVIDVEFNLWNDWAVDAAVVVRDDAGVLFAGATGYYSEVWPELSGASGLDVDDAGATEALPDQGCGDRSAHALRFEADDAIELDVWEAGTVTWGGQVLAARNVGAWAFDGQVSCTDVWGPMPWFVFRAP